MRLPLFGAASVVRPFAPPGPGRTIALAWQRGSALAPSLGRLGGVDAGDAEGRRDRTQPGEGLTRRWTGTSVPA